MNSFKMLATGMTLMAACSAYAQNDGVGIGTSKVNGDAILEIESSSKGILIPQVSTDQRSAMTPITESLLVYDSIIGAFYFYDGDDWQQLIASSAQSSLDMDNQKISNIRAGTSSGDVVNKGQMDAAVIPPGGIIMWNGNESSIPEGWALCDGYWYNPANTLSKNPTSSVNHTVNTPDLRGRFVVGLSGSSPYPNVGGYGGTTTSATTKIVYNKQDEYTTDKPNCSPYQYLYSGNVTIYGTDCNQSQGPHVVNNIPGHNLVNALENEFDCLSSTCNDCEQTENPQYYVGNYSCRMGATAVNVNISTENRPLYYVLAYIMKI